MVAMAPAMLENGDFGHPPQRAREISRGGRRDYRQPQRHALGEIEKLFQLSGRFDRVVVAPPKASDLTRRRPRIELAGKLGPARARHAIETSGRIHHRIIPSPYAGAEPLRGRPAAIRSAI